MGLRTAQELTAVVLMTLGEAAAVVLTMVPMPVAVIHHAAMAQVVQAEAVEVRTFQEPAAVFPLTALAVEAAAVVLKILLVQVAGNHRAALIHGSRATVLPGSSGSSKTLGILPLPPCQI